MVHRGRIETESAQCEVQVGDTWQAQQGQHHGWRVRVVKVTAGRIRFRCYAGPSHALGVQHWMTRTIFETCYLPLRRSR